SQPYLTRFQHSEWWPMEWWIGPEKRRVSTVTNLVVTNELGVVAWTKRGVPTVTNIAVTNEDVGSSKGGDPKDINTMTDTLEPEETGVGGLQLPGKYQVVFMPSERITIRGCLDYKKAIIKAANLARRQRGESQITLEERSARYACTSHAEKVPLKKNDLLEMHLHHILRLAPITNTDFVLGCCNVLALHLEVPEVVHHRPSRRDSPEYDGVNVGRSQGDIVMIRIIETVQIRHLVMGETTEIMILKEADMKLLLEVSIF
ncbi:hypothetical protein Tco_1296323, partial [Tanacetum coccineum]